MRFALFYHSLISDWNHGNAHFLRGVVRELLERGHDVRVYEPHDAWSVENLVRDHGEAAIDAFHAAYPGLESIRYHQLDLDAALADTDVAIVHEWNDPALVARIGEHRARHSYTLLFHDTHHRMVTAPADMARYDLAHYDGVLAFGRVIRDLYRARGAKHAWTWHEAADTRVFYPRSRSASNAAALTSPGGGDLVWIGNWGDDERTRELHDMLIAPVRELRLRARVHGVRYPAAAKQSLACAGIEYAGWLANFDAPDVFARYRVTVHVPRRPYVEALPGIPTIRPFEALACGIPLISAPWRDDEQLFTADMDYLVARNTREMLVHLSRVLSDTTFARQLARHGRQTILARHTCGHRVDELLTIVEEVA